jgi:type IV secretory pathway TraG/TraD family ATPase VirD4
MEQIARILVRAGSPGSSNSDPFWLDGAERFVSLFAKCLLNADDMKHFTLSNLYHVLQNFGSEGNGLYRFMEIYTKIPGRPYDNTLVDEWNALLVGNPKTIDGMIMSAQVALKSLASSNIAKITSFSSFSLSELRERKTIIYFISPSQHASYYAFFTSIFFQSVFNSAMRKLPEQGDLPIYVLYDEFAHSTIPDFTTTVTTIRKYKVSISVVLQSIRQLDIRYGKDQAEAMLGGFNSYMTLSGSDLQTTKFFEGMVGSVRRETRDTFLDPKRTFDERNLMNSDEVRRMGAREMLLVSTNRQAVKVNMQPFFENREMMRAVRRGAYQLPRNPGNIPLKFVPLR